MEIIIHENGPFLVNTYLVINKKNKKGFIIDPGHDLDLLISKVKKNKIDLEAIVATHGHIDHVEGVKKIKDEFNLDFYLNDLDKELLSLIPTQARMFGVPDPGIPVANKNLPTSGKIKIADLELELLHTPGHSKGSISLKIDQALFSGDALFNFSIGRTDLPGGDYAELIKAIKTKLFVLPEDTKVYPGHGPTTTIGREKAMNPFFR